MGWLNSRKLAGPTNHVQNLGWLWSNIRSFDDILKNTNTNSRDLAKYFKGCIWLPENSKILSTLTMAMFLCLSVSKSSWGVTSAGSLISRSAASTETTSTSRPLSGGGTTQLAGQTSQFSSEKGTFSNCARIIFWMIFTQNNSCTLVVSAILNRIDENLAGMNEIVNYTMSSVQDCQKGQNGTKILHHQENTSTSKASPG